MNGVFGITLRKLRTEKELSVAELARLIDESEVVIKNIETGYMEATDAFIKKVSEYFDVDIQYLSGQIGGAESLYLSDFFEETLIFRESDLSRGALYETQAIDKLKVCRESTEDRRIAIRVESNDMKNSRIQEGDIAVIKLQKTAKDGDIVLVKTIGGNVLLRRYMRKGRQIKLFADPQGYKIPEISYDVMDESYEIIGKIVSCTINI